MYELPLSDISRSVFLTYNALTIDVEDWYHVCGSGTHFPVPPKAAWRVRGNIEKILNLLCEFDQKATFFMLGSVAENDPGLAPMICSAGHEIASHGYSHRLVTELKPQQFLDELLLTGRILSEQTGQQPVGYRAPQWSLSGEDSWAFAILRKYGYLYDSSLNPLLFVGNPMGSRFAYRLAGAGEGLWEIPPMVTRSVLGNLPTGGGWGFRFFPAGMIANTIEEMNQAGQAAVLYLHPRELDPEGPRLKLPALKRFVSYGTREDATSRLRELFQHKRFTTLKELVATWQHAS